MNESEKLAVIDEILAIINPQPPEGAFTTQEVMNRAGNRSSLEGMRQLLLKQVETGKLKTGMFFVDGHQRRFFWKE